MNIKILLDFLLTSFFNPISFIFYATVVGNVLPLFGIKVHRTLGTNSIRLSLPVYLIAAPTSYGIWCVFSYYLLNSFHLLNNFQLLNNFNLLNNFSAPISFADIILIQHSWLIAAAYVFTALVLILMVSKQGLEANIIGFIIAPPMLASTLIVVFFHIKWLWQYALEVPLI